MVLKNTMEISFQGFEKFFKYGLKKPFFMHIKCWVAQNLKGPMGRANLFTPIFEKVNFIIYQWS